MIAKVYRFANELVMVFDEHGQQLGQYQGRWSEVRELILSDAGPATEFILMTDWATKEQRPMTDLEKTG